MNTIDQYRAILPPDKQLMPGPSLVDGRTSRDRLNFLCDFGTLINFYDKDNTIQGSWEPFLLKDPVFLLANISATRYREYHLRHINTCNKLTQLLEDGTDSKGIALSFNMLLDEYTEVFMKIKRWIYFMQRNDDEYDLKNYVIHQTRSCYLHYFRAVIVLRQLLHKSDAVPGVSPVDLSKFFYFDDYGEQQWRRDNDEQPSLEILGLGTVLTGDQRSEIFLALKNAGDQLFGFFHTIVLHADAEYSRMRQKEGRYPDTILLRAFVDILKIHQDQLNGIARKHLEFYYRNVLQQNEKPAGADNVYLCAELARPGATFMLPAGTQFNAGVDAQKNTILFGNPGPVDLNPASITSGYTLSSVPAQGPANASRLYLRPIPTPGVLQTDKDGKVRSWQTFGGVAGQQAAPVKTGFALASPMLLLREGTRKIGLQLNFNKAVDPKILAGVAYYLSTQNAWLLVSGIVRPLAEGASSSAQLTIDIELGPSVPPIEAFRVNPDGIESFWPMLKIEFGALSNLSAPPVLTSVTVSVTVNGVKTFQLYNDHGALSTQKAYPPFGPLPLVNSEFIIGSSELFSKPLSSLIIVLNWDNLPITKRDSTTASKPAAGQLADFPAYYQQYNNYIDPPPPSKCFIIRSVKAIVGRVKKLLDQDPPPATPKPFNNTCFKVDFDLLENGAWTDITMTKLALNDRGSDHPYIVYPPGPGPTANGPGTVLFSEDDGVLKNISIFGYQPGPDAGVPKGTAQLPAGDPGIQQPGLKYTGASQWGFMRLNLSAPEYGFGSLLYPNVVAWVTMQNAIKVADKDGPSTFLPPANPPFAPLLNAFTASYSASQEYKFDASAADGTYPVQCFLYSPFKNYVVHDSTRPIAQYDYLMDKPAAGTKGVPLWPAFGHNGYLFLELSRLVPTSSLSLYFELARSYGNPQANTPADYYYLSDTGWQQLDLLSDSTNNFSCSGTVKVSIPDDVTSDGDAMPGNNYWLCIAVKGDASLFAQTVFLKTNGFLAQRIGNFTTADTTVPQLAANIIAKTQSAVPQVATIAQPFPSFGGKAAESHTTMTQRVSARLKTKDRAVSPEDYFRLIRQEYGEIYYSKPVFDHQSGTTGVYLVKAYANWTDANAFLPMMTECQEEKISTFLNARTSVFSNVRVSNFDFQYVTISATVIIDPAYAGAAIKKTISQAVDIFLSPWISSGQHQAEIDQEITSTQVSDLLKTIEGVLDADQVTFETWSAAVPLPVTSDKVAQATPTSLLVSGMKHTITCKV